MEPRLQQRIIGTLVLAVFVLLIAPVVFDGEGRIPEKITQIPPPPKRPDLSHIRVPEPTAEEVMATVTPNEEEVAPFVIEAAPQNDKATPLPEGDLWGLQVASFKDLSKAVKLRERLEAADLPVYVREKILSDGTLFTQVFLGPHLERSQVVEWKARIKAEFGEQGLVVRYRPNS